MEKENNNSTGMLVYTIKDINEKFKVAEKGYEFGWMDCARFHRKVKAQTQKQVNLMFKEALENKNKSFDSLYTMLEFLLSNRDSQNIENNKKILFHIFSGSINGYKVIDHILDRAYKNC